MFIISSSCSSFHLEVGWGIKKVLDDISKINKKKEGQHKEKIIQVCVEEFDLNKEEVLTSLKKAVDDRMLKIVNMNNKNSYRIVQ